MTLSRHVFFSCTNRNNLCWLNLPLEHQANFVAGTILNFFFSSLIFFFFQISLDIAGDSYKLSRLALFKKTNKKTKNKTKTKQKKTKKKKKKNTHHQQQQQKKTIRSKHTTSQQCRFNVTTLQRRCSHVVCLLGIVIR